jgi:hypothetical protein
MTWTGQDWGPEQPRFVTDLTRDGVADIVGFGNDGVWTSSAYRGACEGTRVFPLGNRLLLTSN